jgi:hypothetical protein
MTSVVLYAINTEFLFPARDDFAELAAHSNGDYILIHEIMHLREMNHSSRFWREVERACPDYETAERWLKQHSSLLK